MTDTHSGYVQTHTRIRMHTHLHGAPGSLGNHKNHIFGKLTSTKQYHKPTRKGTLKHVAFHARQMPQLLFLIIINNSDGAVSCLNAAKFIVYVFQLHCHGPLTSGSSSGFCFVSRVYQATDVENGDTILTLQEC